MYQHILVPIDGSATSDRALQEALELARQQNAQVRLIHVVEDILLPETEAFLDYAALQEVIKHNGRNMLARAEAMAQRAGVRTEVALLETAGERIASMIVAEAQHWPADLIVIGTHGRSGFNHLLFGSVAEGVVRTAQTPILLIRAS